jgi:hypothetical protein
MLPACNNDVADYDLPKNRNPMKNFQHLDKLEPDSIEIPFDSAFSMNKRGRDSVSKKDSQNVEASNSMNDNNNVADRIRNYWLHVLIFVLTCHAVFGEIKNGYEKNISASKESLKILRASLLEHPNMTTAQRRKVQSTIATFVDHVSYYELTESLLVQFKSIAPELYAQIDTIRDRLGRPVKVYIKFVPVNGTNVKAEGTTYMEQSDYDKDAYRSEYGEFTVSVKVWIVPRALLVLAHELGHIKYQVPHAASYSEFYKKHYDNTVTANSIGHDVDDPSGKSAIQYANIFQKSYADFLKNSIVKVESPSVVLARLKKNWTKNPYAYKINKPTLESQLTANRDYTTVRTLVSVKPSLTGKRMVDSSRTGETVVSAQELTF